MKKIVFTMLLSFLVLGFSASPALSHTGLESSSPAEGEMLEEALQEITLTFEGKIEKTSSFSLTNEQGEKVQVDDITVNDRQLTGTVKGIPNGAYLIKWNIIGADGHPIQGVIPFSQEAAGSETVAEAPSEDSSIEQEQTSQESQASSVDSNENSSNTWIYMIVSAVVVALLILFLRSSKHDGLH